MRTNLSAKLPKKFTHEGGRAAHTTPLKELRRSLMSCMLWEDEFYEDGESIAKRIHALASQVSAENVCALAVEAREGMHLRHAPLWLILAILGGKHGKIVGDTIARIIQRPDEITEILAMYWKGGKRPLAKQLKRGIAGAFSKFSEYQFAKYDRDTVVKLRDALFLTHPKPSKDQESLYKAIAERTLTTPDTWEVALSGGASKRETFERMITERKLGALAMLRNLRNMAEAGVADSTIRHGLASMNVERVLPFRFIAAARFAPRFEPELETAMFKCLESGSKLQGDTILLIDVSGSMDQAISSKSDLRRLDAACGLAMLLREVCEHCAVFTFSQQLVEIPNRRGFALRDAIVGSQKHGGTYLRGAIEALNVKFQTQHRLVVITDEQSQDGISAPSAKLPYLINVASYKNGVGYGQWVHIDGWSESVVDYISKLEQLN